MAEATDTKQEQGNEQVAARVEEAAARAGNQNDVRQVAGHPGPVEQTGPQAVIEKAAHSPQAAKSLSDEERMDALQFMLSDGEEEPLSITQVWELNVGTDEHPKLIQWTIRPVDGDTMNLLRQRGRQEAGLNREARRAGLEPEIDMRLLNLRLIVHATVDPDLQEAARIKGVAAADPYHGPVMLLQRQFSHKPGLVDLLSGHIYRFSGYDEADVRRATPEATMLRAAGN